MNLVLDTNVLFNFFWKNSILSNALKETELNAFSPEFSLGELKKYRELIERKANLEESVFEEKLNDLKARITFVPAGKYEDSFRAAFLLLRDLPEQAYWDLDFLALALKLNCPLWTNDKILKMQKSITVLNTQEVVELLSLKT